MMFCACVGDEQTPAHVINIPTNKELTLRIQIPGTNIPATFAPTIFSASENVMKTADILVFKVSSEGVESYYKHIPIRSIEVDNHTSKQLTVTLDANIKARLIVLANVSHLFTDELHSLLRMDSMAGNAGAENVLNRFVFSLTNPRQISSSEYGFPMYGRSEVVSPEKQQTDIIEMVRAIARIDIANDIYNTRRTIDSVYIFNAKDCGFVAPALDSRGYTKEAPHVPPAAKANGQPFGYVFAPNMGVATPSMESEIYVAEDLQEEDNPTIIVLKVLPEGDAGQAQFYRVDLENAEGEAVPIQRNVRYRIFIRHITGEGYTSASAAAMAGKRKSIDFEMEMNELGLGNIVFNDQYKLAVSELAFHFDGGGTISGNPFGELRVYTTYPVWTASIDASESSWLSFEGEREEGAEVEFPASVHSLIIRAQPNNSGKARTGKIRLRAGTLKQEIIIIQYRN